ncbi:ead/Ea22-like family protein [Salmonella enterica subsp. enterica serovar Agona]|nr:ead/Ea22-like family protein [Salmonella enterica subsp. enterica serovar Agona]EHX9268689.1 ead/Ea22-like family protein [Salmonella enterica subsp. enterica serovar Agona]
MSKIDYQALREAAEKATCGEWSLEYGEERFDAGDALIHREVVGYLPICRIEGAHPESGFDEDFQMEQQANAEFIAAANPATVLALLDERERNQQYIKRRDQENEDIALTVGKLLIENGRLVADTLRHLADNEIDSDYFAITSTNENGTEIDHEMAITDYALQAAGTVDELVAALESAENRIAELTDQKATWVTWAENASGMVDMLRLRIAELEHSETQLINERDAAESALADMYQAATGERPEWSNMFGFADAVDVVEERLATLEANQSQTTPTGIQLITEAIGAHGYIVGCLLQGRPDLALEESRKWVSAFGQAAEIVSAQDADDIKVKGD